MTDLTSLTLADAREGLTQKSFTALELTDAHLAAMEKARVLNAYVLETPDHARAQAKAADATIAKGEAACAPRRARRFSATSFRLMNPQ